MNAVTRQEEQRQLEITKLVKSKLSRHALATMVVDITSKLMYQISTANRYYEIIKQRDRTIADMRVELAVFKAPETGQRRDLMAQAARIAIEHDCLTQIKGDKIQCYNKDTQTWEDFQ